MYNQYSIVLARKSNEDKLIREVGVLVPVFSVS